MRRGLPAAPGCRYVACLLRGPRALCSMTVEVGTPPQKGHLCYHGGTGSGEEKGTPTCTLSGDHQAKETMILVGMVTLELMWCLWSE